MMSVFFLHISRSWRMAASQQRTGHPFSRIARKLSESENAEYTANKQKRKRVIQNVSVLTNDTTNWNCGFVSLLITEILGEVANECFQLIEGR